MPDLEAIRSQAELKYAETLRQLDARHREQLRAALREFGSVDAIPPDVWQGIVDDMAKEQAAFLLLLMLNSHDWTVGEVAKQGGPRLTVGPEQLVGGYSLTAAGRAAQTALQTTETLRDRLRRSLEDARLGDGTQQTTAAEPGAPPARDMGDLGDLTDDGIDKALDDVLTPARREGIAADATTTGITAGQQGAKDRYYEPGAGGSVEIDMVWVTERDRLVCPRCAPLNGTTEDVWGKVFPDGPGPQVHPNCRCSLRPQVRLKETDQ